MLHRVTNKRYFYTHINRVPSSYFAKYFYDIYSEYITSYTVMIYVTSDAIRVTHPQLRTIHSGLRSDPARWIIQ
jgi:hypothetical protein